MLKKILFILLYIGVNGCFAQEIKWAIPPIVDSLTENNLTKHWFTFSSNGKKGFACYGSSISVPAEYTEIISGDDNHCNLYLIKNNNNWGIYDTYNHKEILPCLYDTIIRSELPLFKILKGNTYTYFNSSNLKWQTNITINSKGPKKKIEKDISLADAIEVNELRSDNYTTEEYDELKNFEKYLSNNKRFIDTIGNDFLEVYIFKREYRVVYRISTKTIVADSIDRGFIAGKYLFVHRFKNSESMVIDTLTGRALTPLYTKVDRSYTGYFYDNHLSRNYILAKIKDKHGLYTRDYETIIPFDYSNILFGKNKNLVYCELKDKNSFSIFDLNTKKYIENNFDKVQYYSTITPIVVQKGNKLFTYDLTLNKTVKLPFNRILNSISNDSILLVYVNKHFKIYNLNQQCFKSESNDSIAYIKIQDENSNEPQSEKSYLKSLLAFRKNSKWGLINRNGTIIIESEYDSIECFSRPYHDPIYNFTMNGEFIVLKKGNYLSLFDIQKSITRLDSLTQYRIVDLLDLKTKSTDFWYKRGSTWGKLNLTSMQNLINIADTFYLNKDIYILKQNGEYRTFDYRKLQPETELYDTIINWIDNNYLVIKNKKFGILNKGGENRIRCQNDSIYYRTPSYWGSTKYIIVLIEKKRCGFRFTEFSNEEPFLTPIVFDDYKIGTNGYVWAKYNGKWGILSKNQ